MFTVLKLIPYLARMSTKKKFDLFVRDTQSPEQAYSRLWKKTFSLISRSRFWADRMGSSQKLEDFDLTDFETYRSVLDQAYAHSMRSPLTAEPLLFWAETGGTTAEAKLFPVTRSFQTQFQRTNPPLVQSWTRRFPKFLSQPVLYFASSTPNERSPVGIERGYISGYNYRNIGGLLKKAYAFPIEIFKDREFFIHWAPLYALRQDLSAMVAITPSMLEVFVRSIRQDYPSLLEYLEGKKIPPAPLPRVHCPPDRLSHLKALANRTDSFTALDLWPSLQFTSCWKTSTCGMQLTRIQDFFLGVPIVDATYSATEGWMTVPLENDRPGGPLHPGAHLVEFLPVDAEVKKENLIKPWQLQEDHEYEIFLTTDMGFVRYRLYDVVRCTGFYNRSPVLEFVGKSGNLISLGHTRISESVLMGILPTLKQSLPSRWILAPCTTGKQMYLHYVQGERSDSDWNPACNELDHRLQEASVDYREDIRDRLLNPIVPKALPTTHPLWNRFLHAQTKPVVIHQKPV